MGVVIGIVLVWKGRAFRRLNIRVSRPAAVMGLLAVLGGAIVFDGVSGGRLSRRLFHSPPRPVKRPSTVTFEGATSSRKALVEASYQNFKNSPVTGIGFQVSTAEHFVKTASLFTLPSRKGFCQQPCWKRWASSGQ